MFVFNMTKIQYNPTKKSKDKNFKVQYNNQKENLFPFDERS